jgi:hypothetical protein
MDYKDGATDALQRVQENSTEQSARQGSLTEGLLDDRPPPLKPLKSRILAR